MIIIRYPWYITNDSLHKAIYIPTFNTFAKLTYKKHTKFTVKLTLKSYHHSIIIQTNFR